MTRERSFALTGETSTVQVYLASSANTQSVLGICPTDKAGWTVRVDVDKREMRWISAGRREDKEFIKMLIEVIYKLYLKIQRGILTPNNR
jgi:hypothetical protein